MGIDASKSSRSYSELYLPSDTLRLCEPGCCPHGGYHRSPRHMYVERYGDGRERYHDPYEYMDRFAMGGGWPGIWRDPGDWTTRDMERVRAVLAEYNSRNGGQQGGGMPGGGWPGGGMPGGGMTGPWMSVPTQGMPWGGNMSGGGGGNPLQAMMMGAGDNSYRQPREYHRSSPRRHNWEDEMMQRVKRMEEIAKEYEERVTGMSNHMYGSDAERQEEMYKRRQNKLWQEFQLAQPAMNGMGSAPGMAGPPGMGGVPPMGPAGQGGMFPMGNPMMAPQGMGQTPMMPQAGMPGLGGMNPMGMNPMGMNPMGGGGFGGGMDPATMAQFSQLMGGGGLGNAGLGSMGGFGDRGGGGGIGSGMGKRGGSRRPRRNTSSWEDDEDDDDDMGSRRRIGGRRQSRRTTRFGDDEDFLGGLGGGLGRDDWRLPRDPRSGPPYPSMGPPNRGGGGPSGSGGLGGGGAGLAHDRDDLPDILNVRTTQVPTPYPSIPVPAATTRADSPLRDPRPSALSMPDLLPIPPDPRHLQRPTSSTGPSIPGRTPGAPMFDHGLHEGSGGLPPGTVPYPASADPLRKRRSGHDIREGGRPFYPPEDLDMRGATFRSDAAKNVRFEPTVETVKDSDSRERDGLGGADVGGLPGPRK